MNKNNNLESDYIPKKEISDRIAQYGIAAFAALGAVTIACIAYVGFKPIPEMKNKYNVEILLDTNKDGMTSAEEWTAGYRLIEQHYNELSGELEKKIQSREILAF